MVILRPGRELLPGPVAAVRSFRGRAGCCSSPDRAGCCSPVRRQRFNTYLYTQKRDSVFVRRTDISALPEMR